MGCASRVLARGAMALVLLAYCIASAMPLGAESQEPQLAASVSDEVSLEGSSGLAATWAMFKNQPSRTSFNPFEVTINRNNAIFLGLSWVGIMGDLVDYSSPAVVDGVAYVASLDGNLYAFNANGCGQSTCNPLWTGVLDNNYSATSSPAVVNRMVYVGSENHKLYVFSATGCGQSTCAPVWTATTGGAIFSGPLVVNNVVYVASEDHRLYAYNALGCGHSLCPALWTGTTGGALDSAPSFANGVVYVGSQDGKLYAFNASGCGRLQCNPLWTAQVGVSVFGSSPAAANGVVYIASFTEANGSGSKLYAFNANGCSGASCEPLWTAPAGEFVVSSPAVANGRVYVGSGDALLYAFDANGCNQPTCSFLWRGEAVGAQAAMLSAPAVANGLVYVGENNGMVEVFDANGCNNTICLPVTQLQTQGEQIVSSSPAVVNGAVYVGSANQFAPPIGRLYVYKLTR